VFWLSTHRELPLLFGLNVDEFQSHMAFKITYSVLNADLSELHTAFEAALAKVQKSALGKSFPSWVAGQAVESDELVWDLNPADTRQKLAAFQQLPMSQVDRVMQVSKSAAKLWGRTAWKTRVAQIRKAADLISERRLEFAAIMTLETGKNRLESLGDVEESADLLRYYATQLEEAEGFDRPMGALSPNEKTRDVLKPYGVFVVISPFNFPMALAAGMAGGALLGGNSVVLKPAADTPWCAELLYQVFRDAGLPEGVFQLVHGGGSKLGRALVEHPLTDGIAFTGSKEVGMQIFHKFSQQWVKPCFMEMGGKNPTFVCASADLKKAVEGCARSAFGLSGQKCSALSRVFVHESVYSSFVTALSERIAQIRVGNPAERDVYMGPVINESALQRFLKAVAEGRRDGKVLVGGEDLRTRSGLEHGHFASPTLIEINAEHRIAREEHFAPLLTIHRFKDLENTIAQANGLVEYGLTSGIFSEDTKEVDLFMDTCEAGVLYANRMSGATTGAWPGVNPFCGWKGSGSTGKGGCGPYYVSQFMKEQSQTRMM
jgi:1-pyrroline-5-carboxylate dehydrogenase